MKPFSTFFETLTGTVPWAWQAELANDTGCHDRILRIPTGFGKTAGTVLPWLFHRMVRNDEAWPTRLAFCLPMRVLVEQTHANVATWVERAGLKNRVGLHVLLGGVDAAPWVIEPERPAILIGTQDMLLSRALMRGYASARARWPMEFGLLNTDTLWIFDEVQLMGVGLATSTQLAAFRERAHPQSVQSRPTRSWWMSATLQPSWLSTVDFAPRIAPLISKQITIPKSARSGGLFAVSRTIERATNSEPSDVAALVRSRHQAGSITLVVANTVKRAVAIASELRRKPKGKSPPFADICLVHSRFRGADRQGWSTSFLSKSASLPPEGRVIVATQVVEAGVDLSARFLVSDLAPWASLVQRFGRCARYLGESGNVIVVGTVPEKSSDALPYELTELAASAAALDELGPSADPAALERFEEGLAPNRVADLYPYQPEHVIRAKDVRDLFDTTPDLNGADLDVGRFIREGVDRDVSVFWRAIEGTPSKLALAQEPFPQRAELCPVPLFGDGGFEKAWVDKKREAWVYDYLDETWVRVRRRPAAGSVVMLRAKDGGYSDLGWSPASAAPVDVVVQRVDLHAQQLEAATSGQGDDSLSEASQWQSIADHGRDVGELARRIASIAPAIAPLLDLAGRWHDAGKVHPAFQNRIDSAKAPQPHREWAKAPPSAWTRKSERRGFRHELASTLMLLETARAGSAEHSAESMGELLSALGLTAEPRPMVSGALVEELGRLSKNDFDLVAYLVCAHHGKVRLQWAASPHDAEIENRLLGVDDKELVPPVTLATGDTTESLPSTSLYLDCARLGFNTRFGRSWTERVEGLVSRLGEFQLGWLEAVFRAADWQASAALEGGHQ